MSVASAWPADSTFIERIRAGDEHAYEELFHRHYLELCRYAARISPGPGVAEEIVQEVFLKVWLRRERLREVTTLRSYLYAAVRNHAFNQIKRNGYEERWRQGKASEQVDAPAAAAGADDEVRAAELTVAIERALASLPNRCRQAFLLQRREHMSVAEIAEAMAIAPKTVEVQIGNALKLLRRHLAEWLQGD
jgi:RNA polymerase sigma-70 factor (ECF subfamily)